MRNSWNFQTCVGLVVFIGSLWAKPLQGGIELDETQDVLKMVAQEEAAESRLQKFLGTMKEEFLRKLNLSSVPQEHSRVHPPQFMIELYNKYASDKSSVPRSDVIRSFVIQDVTHSITNGSLSKHRLLFNVSIPSYEEITMVQLRLFTLTDKGPATSCHGVLATVNVYEVEHRQGQAITHLLDGREAVGIKHSWETFDVTSAIQRWVKSGHAGDELEVQVKRRNCGFHKSGSFDVSLSLKGNTSAILIVFSNDLNSRKKEARKEVKEMMMHEEDVVLAEPDAPPPFSSEEHYSLHPRRKRHAKKKNNNNYCRRNSLRVNFKDIGWDKWIVAPPEYDAFECIGMCFFPLTDDLTPSKHAIIQTLINLKNPKKANKACCVPTKLDPITVMYQEKGIITVRHMYEDMKVAECGCR
ncbi:growth/differentiation factor 2 [Denticeps clupeoides]|uniref:TGF-beta family profile domain-containing protein n=1 Tax=Denticeps clupeoides TaxID=299321 RepID=A0AAY4CT44_9TELE|nr:growth/differentiation factor 2-like [Denticeps clupeoides]